MATLKSGLNGGSGFSNSDTVTSTTLNNHINDGGIVAGTIATADMATSTGKTDGVTFAKMQHISTAKVLGRTTAGEGDVEEVSLLDEDDMSSDSATAVATQQSIKAYVTSINSQFFHLQQKNNSGIESTDTLTVGSYTKRNVTSQGNTISGASVSSGTITLPAGTYEIRAFAQAGTGFFGNTLHRTRLRNTTDNTTAILGGCVVTIGQSGLDNQAIPASPLQGYIVIGSSKNFQLQHFVSVTSGGASTVKGGIAVSSGESEVYADIFIKKVD